MKTDRRGFLAGLAALAAAPRALQHGVFKPRACGPSVPIVEPFQYKIPPSVVDSYFARPPLMEYLRDGAHWVPREPERR